MLIEIGYDCDKIIHQNKRIIKSQVSMSYNIVSKLFVSSEGSKIHQNFSDVIADLSATAHENGLTQSVNITEGGRGGIEKLSTDREIRETAKSISDKAAQLIDAKPVKEEKTTVVMNPDFVALLTHEILGHPSEADRVLGKEMAWAGGAWWAGKLEEKIGSDNLNVFDDPTLEGTLGHYGFDDEGNKATRTELVKNGVLSNHMQSRSIDMKRYNWSISCQFAQKIENGEITDLLRDVIVLGTAPDFFKSIDACGKDFTVRPITNCGKGDPMQSMVMGNGGPSIRATAIVRSA